MKKKITVFFFNDTATTEIYTLSLHDALPIFVEPGLGEALKSVVAAGRLRATTSTEEAVRDTEVSLICVDRKSTRLNSSHANISYAVFCLKKKKLLTHHSFFSLSSHSLHFSLS